MEIFKLFGKIFIEDEDAQRKLGNIGEKASSVAGKLGLVAENFVTLLFVGLISVNFFVEFDSEVFEV